MAKISYRIPDSLDKSHLDVEIAMRNKDGIGLRPLPIKVLLLYFMTGMANFWALQNTFLKDSGLGVKVLFTIVWWMIAVLLLKRDDTDLMNYNLVPTMLNYVVKGYRNVITRRSHDPTQFYLICGIENINEDNGLISFMDGTYGYMYSVVGSGSILLFERDKNDILDRVDAFYRKMKTDYELIFITTKEAQRVKPQVEHLYRLLKNLEVPDADLISLLEKRRSDLVDFVGEEFRSIHQYLLIKADNKEALTSAKNMLIVEAQSSNLVIKQAKALFEEIIDVLALVYKGGESV